MCDDDCGIFFNVAKVEVAFEYIAEALGLPVGTEIETIYTDPNEETVGDPKRCTIVLRNEALRKLMIGSKIPYRRLQMEDVNGVPFFCDWGEEYFK